VPCNSFLCASPRHRTWPQKNPKGEIWEFRSATGLLSLQTSDMSQRRRPTPRTFRKHKILCVFSSCLQWTIRKAKLRRHIRVTTFLLATQRVKKCVTLSRYLPKARPKHDNSKANNDKDCGVKGDLSKVALNKKASTKSTVLQVHH